VKLLLIEEDPLKTSVSPQASNFETEDSNLADSEISRFEIANELKRLIVTSITLNNAASNFGNLPTYLSDSSTVVKNFVVGNSGSLMTAITSNHNGEAALIGKSINISRFFEILESIADRMHNLEVEHSDEKLDALQYMEFLESCRSLKSFLEMDAGEIS
jgi:hypothetical protein